MRAPDIYHHILDKCSDKLVRLGNIATVKFGIKTGANAFFYLTKDCVDQWGIEEYYRAPIMTSPQESRSIVVDEALLPKQIFLCHSEKERLRGTAALEYILWGESEGYHRRRSVASRRRWYDLGKNLDTTLALGCRVNKTSQTMLALGGLHFDKAFL